MIYSGVPSPAGSAELVSIAQVEQFCPAGSGTVAIVVRTYTLVVSPAELGLLVAVARPLPLLTH